MLLTMREITARYRHGGLLSARDTTVLHQVNMEIARGEIVGLLGESGSGKSTLGKIIGGLLRPASGSVWFQGKRIEMPYRGELRRCIQMMAQHPETALNPRLKILRSLLEPYEIYRLPYEKKHLLAYLRQFGIYEEHIEKYPAQVSGGEIQRICLSRVLLLQPELLILDEATSMLDVISQAQIVRLLEEIHRQRGMAFLFITHDQRLAELFCHRIYRIEKGVVREM
ncbi:MAG: ABC transporter ATP-binding protein [Schwartzia sp. (in: firmicutes)]